MGCMNSKGAPQKRKITTLNLLPEVRCRISYEEESRHTLPLVEFYPSVAISVRDRGGRGG